MALDFRKAQYFVALFEEGSISRAAERLNIVQPALSMQLRQLEAELGIRLFDRSAQGVQPTPAARHFYGLCTGLLRQVEAVRQEMHEFTERVVGEIRVGLMPSICRGPLSRILSDYTARYPDVEVGLFESPSGALADMVIAGDLDFAVCNPPNARSTLLAMPLFSDPLRLVSGPRPGLVPGCGYRLTEIPELKLILPWRRNSIRLMIDRHIKSGEIRAARVMEIDGLNATMKALEGSDWSTLVPRIAVIDDVGGERFVVNPVLSPEMRSEIVEIHPAGRPLTLPAALMVDTIRSALWAIDEAGATQTG
jgi:LysR family nitrogen assimilation transcriptional regulator